MFLIISEIYLFLFRTHVNQDVYKATYVFLPIVVKDGIPMIEWKDEWKLEDYE